MCAIVSVQTDGNDQEDDKQRRDKKSDDQKKFLHRDIVKAIRAIRPCVCVLYRWFCPNQSARLKNDV